MLPESCDPARLPVLCRCPSRQTPDAVSTRTYPVACNRDCGGGCPLLATVEGGRVVRIANNPAGGPFLKGCVRGYRAYLQQQAADRLTTPLVRTGPRGSGQFREAGWDEALGLVASRLAIVIERHGNDSIIALSGSGSCRGALHDTGALTARFLNLDRRSRRASRTRTARRPRPTSNRSCSARTRPGSTRRPCSTPAMIVLWGANIVDCIMGCEWRARVREAKRRGVPVVVIDPRRTETAKQLGTEWLPVRPGTDSALMLAVPARADHRVPRGRGVRRRARDGMGGAAAQGARAGGRAGRRWRRARPAAGAGRHAGVGRGGMRDAGGAHRRAGARLGAPPPDRARPRPLDPAHLGRGGGRAPGDRPAGRDGQPRAPRRFVGRPHLGRPARAAPRGHPGATESRHREHRRKRLGRRRHCGTGRRPSCRHPRRPQRGRQLRRSGRRRPQERPRHAGTRVHRLPRPVPDRDREVLRRRPAGHALARARRRRVHECQLPALLAQGGRAAGAGARRLRDLRRDRRAHGRRGAVHRGQGRRRPGCASSSSAPRSRTRTSSAPLACTSRPTRSA